MMEGISHEACSLAGTLKLGKLIVFYDDNGISIDGEVQGWFADDTPKRFEAYGWHVQTIDGMDDAAIARAIRAAQAESTRPSLIDCKTIIGWGAPTKAGTAATHGEALGAEEVAGARKKLGWTAPPFEVPESCARPGIMTRPGAPPRRAGRSCSRAIATPHPALADEFERRMRGELPANWPDTARAALAAGQAVSASQATRQSSQAMLNLIGPALPELFGGSADLTPSNNTLRKGAHVVTRRTSRAIIFITACASSA
jgi:transketolase